MSDATTLGKKKLPLHWKMGIGFSLGLLVGLVVHATGGADAEWVKWVTAYVTTPFSKVFLSLIFMLIVPLLFSALVVGIAEMGDIRALGAASYATPLLSTFWLMLSGVGTVQGTTIIACLLIAGGGALGAGDLLRRR